MYADDFLDYIPETHEVDYKLLIRNNQDKTINHRGRKLIEFCQTLDIIIINGVTQIVFPDPRPNAA